jgi:hypothetical protein
VRRVLGAGLAIALASCGGLASEGKCIETPEAAAFIAHGLTVQGGGRLRNAFAVPLADNDEFGYIVAAELDGPGMEGGGDIGTWAVLEIGGGPDGSPLGPIIAVNTIAQEFSRWGTADASSPLDAATNAAGRSEEADAAEKCASR